MRNTNKWQDYELIDASSGERLERWGDIILIRPDPQAVFATERRDKDGEMPTQDISAQKQAEDIGNAIKMFLMCGA